MGDIMESITETKYINYEQLIAGALLRLPSFDVVDASILSQGIKKKLGVTFTGSWEGVRRDLYTYFEFERDKISASPTGIARLLKEVTLDTPYEDEGCTLREKLQEIAGEDLVRYFDSIDMEAYQANKQMQLQVNKKEIPEMVNVLLISEDAEDYDMLVRNGFKNICWYKSFVRANEYFSQHPEDLDCFHIVIRGEQKITNPVYDKLSLEKKIDEMEANNKIVTVELMLHIENDFDVWLRDNIIHRSWLLKTYIEKEAINGIIESCLVNQVMSIGPKEFKEINTGTTCEALPIRTKKSDLKILYLGDCHGDEEAIARKLGLNIDFVDDDNFTFEEVVRTKLAEYDIIVGSSIFLGKLLRVANEAGEQAKDTGRQLIILATHKINKKALLNNESLPKSDIKQACEIYVDIKYAGEFSHELQSEILEKRLCVVPEAFDLEDGSEPNLDNAIIAAIISIVVNNYLYVVKRYGEMPVDRDEFLKSSKAYGKDYDNAHTAEKARQQKLLQPIIDFNHMIEAIFTYIRNIKAGLIKNAPSDLRVKSNGETIRVINYENNAEAGSITFATKSRLKDIKLIVIQSPDGRCEKFYIGSNGAKENKIKREIWDTGLAERLSQVPDKVQQKILDDIIRKVDAIVKPLNEEANKTRTNGGTTNGGTKK